MPEPLHPVVGAAHLQRLRELAERVVLRPVASEDRVHFGGGEELRNVGVDQDQAGDPESVPSAPGRR